MSKDGTDEELLEAWSRGDKRAGNALFQRHFDTLRRFFANKVGDAAEVEDLVQRTFMACVDGRERFEGRATFRAYLLGIARHQCHKHWTNQHRARLHDDIDDHAIAELTPKPSSILARNQNERMLLEALRHIPLREQTIIELCYWEQLNGREISEILQIPEDSVRSVLRRAKLKLGKQLRRMQQITGIPESTDEDLERWALSLRAQLD